MSAAEVIELLRQRGETVALCESLTAGLAAATLADVPGASAALRGGLVTYASEVKAHFTHVPLPQLLRQRAVSAPTAAAMARAAIEHIGATWGVSLTGVAGPDLQEGQPAGTVFIAVMRAGGEPQVSEHHFPGGRAEVRRASVEAALGELLRQL